MNKFLTLLRVEIMQLFRSIYPAKRKGSSGAMIIAILLPAALCLYTTGTYTAVIITQLPAQYSYVLLMMGAVLVVGLLFSLTFYSAGGHLFRFKDHDLLMSLPIDRSLIFTNKLVAYWLYHYYFTFFLLVAPVCGYLYQTGFSLLFLVYAIFGSLFLPMIPLLISAFFAFFVELIASRFRLRNQIQLLTSLVLILAIVVGSTQINQLLTASMQDINAIWNLLQTYLPFVYYYVHGLATMSAMEILIGVGISCLAGILFILFFQKAFQTFNQAGNISKRTTKKVQFNSKEKSIVASMFQKEWNRYINMPMYVLNTIVGPLLVLLGTLYLMVKTPADLAVLLDMPNVKEQFFPLLLAGLCFMSVTSCTTASSISLEGKSLWLLKSLPVAAKQIFFAKIGVNLVVLLPTFLLSGLLLAMRLKFSAMQVVILCLMCVLVSIFTSIIGLLVNLLFPKLDWVSEVQVVKQSLSVILSMAIGAIVFGGMFFLFYKLGNIASVATFIWIGIAVIALLDVILWMVLLTQGKILFEKL